MSPGQLLTDIGTTRTIVKRPCTSVYLISWWSLDKRREVLLGKVMAPQCQDPRQGRMAGKKCTISGKGEGKGKELREGEAIKIYE